MDDRRGRDSRAGRHDQHPHRAARRPTRAPQAHVFPSAELKLPTYEKGTKVATRKAYGDALAAIGAADGTVVALDGEVGNSTYTETFANKFPERFFQMYIAEQQMIGAAVGMQVRGWKPFSATFAAFLSRAYDFIRMAAVSQANLYLCGSHAGVSIGEDGPSQMGLEDIAAMRAVHGSTVLYPVRCKPDSQAHGADGRQHGHQLHPHDPPGDAGDLWRR